MATVMFGPEAQMKVDLNYEQVIDAVCQQGI